MGLIRRTTGRCLALIAAVWSASSVVAAGPTDPCLVRVEAFTMPSVDLTLTFTVPGVVADLLVEDGTMVKAGQSLARLDNREAVSQIALYRIRAASTLAEDLASAQLDLARAELARARTAFEQGGMGDFEVKRRELEARVAEIKLASATQDREEAKLTLEQAEAVASRSILSAPVDGMVERTLVDVGESVERLQPVMRLVVTDPVRMEAAVPIARAMEIKVGAPVSITGIDVAATLTGTVERVASVADAASGTVLVSIVAPNPGGVPAGTRVWVELAGNAGDSPGVRAGDRGVE